MIFKNKYIMFLNQCPCGCNEKYYALLVGKFGLWFFTDCGSWWIRIKFNNKKWYGYSDVKGWHTEKVYTR